MNGEFSTVGFVVKIVLGFLLTLIAITILFGSWYTIDQRELGVILRNGKLIGTATPGLNFKLPWVDSVIEINLEQKVVRYERANKWQLHVYSRDQQPAVLDVTVSFRAVPGQVTKLYEEYGSVEAFVDRRITPTVLEEVKSVFGTYNAATAIQQRVRLNNDAREAVINSIGKDSYVMVTDVQVTNIDYSDAYEKSIEQRMLAEVEVQKVLQNVEREKATALITVTQANAQADATRARAQAEADAIRLRGEAEATAIQARGQALGNNPHLVTLVQAEKWNGVLPQTMLPGAALPMINLRQ